MTNEKSQDYEVQVFGDYCVPKILPFRISQPPFRKFSRYKGDGHWNEKQRLKYTVFLEFFQKLLEDEEGIRNARIYEMMADMIITRDSSQCRSHHQKMEQHRKTITQIITSVRQKYEPSIYEEHKERYSVLIKTLLQNSDKYVRLPANKPKKDGRPKYSARRYDAISPGKNQQQSIQKQNRNSPVEADDFEVTFKKDEKDNRRTREDYSDEEEQQEEPRAKTQGYGHMSRLDQDRLENPIKICKSQKYENPRTAQKGFYVASSIFSGHGYTFSKEQCKEKNSNSGPQVKCERKDSSQKAIQEFRDHELSEKVISPEPIRRQASLLMMNETQLANEKGSQQMQAKDQNNAVLQNPFRSSSSPFNSFGHLQNYMYLPSNSTNSHSSPFPYSADPITSLNYQIISLEQTRKHHYDEATRLCNEWRNEMMMESQVGQLIQRLRQQLAEIQRG